jgi:phage-related protein
MSKTKIVFYANEKGESLLLPYFDIWPKKVVDKFYVRIERLEELGHELKRPEADFLRDGIYELRVRHIKVNYRILYFFSGKIAVLYDGLTKEKIVPPKYINRAIAAKESFDKNPTKHTYEAEDNEN